MSHTIAVYGGSFNPPHWGHAMVASWVRWAGLASEVWFVPTFAHPFGKDLRPFDDRVAACDALVRCIGGHGFNVSRIEERLPRPSYTRQTLDAFQVMCPLTRFRLVIGGDVWHQRHLWEGWDDLAARYPPIVANRVGIDPVPGSPCFPSVSSTEIRRRLDLGEAVDDLVPEDVLAAWHGRGW